MLAKDTRLKALLSEHFENYDDSIGDNLQDLDLSEINEFEC